jgi:excisionase family DNA binding protein
VATDLETAVEALVRILAGVADGDQVAERAAVIAVAAVEMAEPLLTVAEVAARCRVSAATVFRAIGDGSLRAVRPGRSVRIPVTAVAEWSEVRRP